MSKRFIHLSDLHLGYSAWIDPENNDVRNLRNTSDEYKAKCILEVVSYINKCQKGKTSQVFSAVIITGDVIELQNKTLKSGGTQAFDKGLKILEPLFKVCHTLNIPILTICGEHDFAIGSDPSEHKGIPPRWSTRNDSLLIDYPNVHFFHESGFDVDTNRFNGLKIGWIPGRQKGKHAEVDITKWPDELDIIMMHHDNSALLIQNEKKVNCAYLACGHLHELEVKWTHNRMVGRPGHLYSYFDGKGKAWPTGFLDVNIGKQVLIQLFKPKERLLKIERTEEGYNVYGLRSFVQDPKPSIDYKSHTIEQKMLISWGESTAIKEDYDAFSLNGKSHRELLLDIAKHHQTNLFLFEYKRTESINSEQKVVLTGTALCELLLKSAALLN